MFSEEEIRLLKEVATERAGKSPVDLSRFYQKACLLYAQRRDLITVSPIFGICDLDAAMPGKALGYKKLLKYLKEQRNIVKITEKDTIDPDGFGITVLWYVLPDGVIKFKDRITP